MITLYQFGNSVCCQKVRIVLAEKQLAWQGKEVNLFANEQYRPEYLKLNPAGVVPTLVDGDHVVTESTLICEYLDALYPAPSLMPANAFERTKAQRWSKMVDEGLHEGISAISFCAMFRARLAAMSEDQRQGRYRNVGDPKRGDLTRETYEHGASARQVVYAVHAYGKMFARLEAVLADAGPWIMGDQLTLADIALMPYLARLGFLGLLPVWAAELPQVRGWWTRVQQLPSYVTAICAPMRAAELEEMAHFGPTIRADLIAVRAELHALAASVKANG